jgi:hypothetical protein
MSQCDKCQAEYNGFGPTCGACRRASTAARWESLGLDSKGKVAPATVSRFQKPKELCPACSLPVYPLEKAQVDRVIYHQNCFVCAECNTKLRPSDFSKFEGKFYCNTHFQAVYLRAEESVRRVARKSEWKSEWSDAMSPSSASTASTDGHREPEAVAA